MNSIKQSLFYLLPAFMLLTVNLCSVEAVSISYFDGQQHVMQAGDVYDTVSVRESSHLDITGGVINDTLLIASDASAVMTDGLIDGRILFGSNSQMDILGGTVNGTITSYWGQFNIFGGNFSGPIEAVSLAEVIIYGDSFMIGGQSVSGTLDLDFLTSIGALTLTPDAESEFWSGHLTGNLQDGALLDVDIKISRLRETFGIGETANFTLIPEPASLVLFALGSLLARRKMTT